MNLARMMTDRFFIEDQDGTRRGPFKTKFGSGTIMVFQDDFHAAEGERIVQPLSSGANGSNGADGSHGCERIFLVESCSYSTGSRNIPGHYSVRLSEPMTTENTASSNSNTGLGSNDTPGRDRDGNRLDIAASLQSLAHAIERGDFPTEQKAEAQSLLRALLDSPVVTAVLAKNTSRN